MASKIKEVPEGFHTVTPYLIVRDAAGAIDFYKQAFGAEELYRIEGPPGKIGHAEIKIGDSIMDAAEMAYPKSCHTAVVNIHVRLGSIVFRHSCGSRNPFRVLRYFLGSRFRGKEQNKVFARCSDYVTTKGTRSATSM